MAAGQFNTELFKPKLFELTVVCKMYLTVVSFSSISQDILKVSKHAIYQKEAL